MAVTRPIPALALPVVAALRTKTAKPEASTAAAGGAPGQSFLRTVGGLQLRTQFDESILTMLPDPEGKAPSVARAMFPTTAAELPGYGFTDENIRSFNEWLAEQTDPVATLDTIWSSC